ncbi:putative RNA-directed DNA polymerase from transposon X-element [Caerostris extrusa]|uniref:RNA-directed DNA polymerase from transposon X-element n=1 Tax=Caerostris extrusa TaxID=172846 RepID=A0AAV4XCV0_CAEEX|nr:putative RNA-directed DNA polymerase from transposon X-element [Caerostris extrusa]
MRNYYRRLWQRTKDPETKRKFKAHHANIKKLLKSLNNKNWEDTTNSYTHNSTALWRKIKTLRNSSENIPPLNTASGNMAISPAEKAESIADCWEKQFELNNLSDDISDNYIIHQNTLYFNSPTADHYHTISAEDIVNFIKTLNPKKAAGHDKISNNMLIYLPQNSEKPTKTPQKNITTENQLQPLEDDTTGSHEYNPKTPTSYAVGKHQRATKNLSEIFAESIIIKANQRSHKMLSCKPRHTNETNILSQIQLQRRLSNFLAQTSFSNPSSDTNFQ